MSDESRRRGEGSFVAVRIGRSFDSREVLGLARDLKIARAHALGFVVLWEELILEAGDALTGRLTGYTAAHIAEKLGWRGSTEKLIAALARAGHLKKHRSTYIHPYWLSSTTGDYARRRAELRRDDAERKRRERAGRNGPEDVLRTSNGHPPDVTGTSTRSPEINQGPDPDRPPGPPHGGGSVGAERWEWVLHHHESPMNKPVCVRYLDAMSSEDWALCQWVIHSAAKEGPSSSRKKRALRLDSARFLRTQAYLLFRREWVTKLAAPTARPLATETLEREHEREISKIRFLQAKLADESVSDAEKERVRAMWARTNPTLSLEVEIARLGN